MLKRRLIPVLFLQDGWMVRSQTFSFHQPIGDPVHHVRRLVDWDVDELIVLDIGTAAAMTFEHHRIDYRFKPVRTMSEFIALVAVECHIPLTFGGHIRKLDDVRQRIQGGADKVAVNQLLVSDPTTVTAAARSFGSQAVVASIDYRGVGAAATVYADHGKQSLGTDPVTWARRAIDLGCGEILLNAIDRDGGATGYDLDTIDAVAAAVNAPVIVCGGAGHHRHFGDVFERTGASAAAAGNIFHFKENAYPLAKQYLRKKFSDVR